jgi:hypothetical protein
MISCYFEVIMLPLGGTIKLFATQIYAGDKEKQENQDWAKNRSKFLPKFFENSKRLYRYPSNRYQSYRSNQKYLETNQSIRYGPYRSVLLNPDVNRIKKGVTHQDAIGSCTCRVAVGDALDARLSEEWQLFSEPSVLGCRLLRGQRDSSKL